MSKLANPRHEAFVQGLFAGKSADQAFADAGYTPNSGNACRLKGNEKIQARLSELQARAEKQAMLDRAGVLKELLENMRLAREGKQIAAANQALSLYGKEMGMFVDRRLLGISHIQDMSEEELLEFLGGEPEARELTRAGTRKGSTTIGHA